MGSEVQVHRKLSSNHNVARYCGPKSLRGTDGLPSRDAFLLRTIHGNLEEYLSTNWLEHFHQSERPIQLAGVRQSLSRNLTLSRNGKLAVLNIGASTALCKSKAQVDIQFRTTGEPDDPSHTGIYGYNKPTRNAKVATVLADAVKANEVYPALTDQDT